MAPELSVTTPVMDEVLTCAHEGAEISMEKKTIDNTLTVFRMCALRSGSIRSIRDNLSPVGVKFYHLGNSHTICF